MDENGYNHTNGESGQPQDAPSQPQSQQPFQPPVNDAPYTAQGAPYAGQQGSTQDYQPPAQQASQFYQSNYQPDQQQAYGGGEPPQQGPGKKKKKKERRHGVGGIIAVVAVAGILVGCLLMAFVITPIIGGRSAMLPTLPTQEEQQQEDNNAASPELGGEAAQIQDSANPVVEIADQFNDSIVGITTYNKQLVSGQEPMEQALAFGTGFFISNDGYIITNNHVVSSGNLIKVTTSDNEEHVAEVVGGDSATDIAVIKVDGLNDRAVPIGNSDELKVGELAVAIGNVRGDDFKNTVTVGYVSVLDTPVMLNGVQMNMIQTDAAINPGNSGGPLVDSKGQVVGITTAKRYVSGYDSSGNLLNSEGVGYAIPINKAIDIAQQLIENGSIPRAGIGISYALISEVDASLWGTPRGALVADVTAGGPADQAGIQQNDVITAIDGVDLTSGADMPSFADRAVGDTITATVWREGKEYSVELTLVDLNSLS